MLNALASAAADLATPLTPLITGGCTLAAVALTQRFAQRQQAAAEKTATVERAEAVTTELVTAAAALQLALASDHPRWNTWQPRMLALGQSALEFFAGREAGGLAHGYARASRVVLDWHGQSSAVGAGLLRDPYVRLITAISRAALLAEKEVVQAAMKTSEAAAAVMSAYGQDNLYRRVRPRQRALRPRQPFRRRLLTSSPPCGTTSTPPRQDPSHVGGGYADLSVSPVRAPAGKAEVWTLNPSRAGRIVANWTDRCADPGQPFYCLKVFYSSCRPQLRQICAR